MRENEVIEAACVAAMALLWATAAALRLLLVPAVAVVVVLLTPRSRPAPQAAPVLPTVSLATIAAELLELPAAELRAMAGTRRRCSKWELAAMVLAMPI